ncbi:MAG TPA: DedA family protein [Candidatus Luteococcus avicola]|nr:DedA family protein [Candidatus Luteococcus avicola]
MDIAWLLQNVPGYAVYLVIGLLVGVESIGIPVPGETAIITATIASRVSTAGFGPVGIGLAAIVGAVIGDSIGYWVGREKGDVLLNWVMRRFPRHVTPAHLAWAKALMGRYGMGTVFGGRFVALLRMLAGPLAGAMGVHYPTFLVANVLGGICWAGGTVAVVWYLGAAAEQWLARAAWLLLAVLVVGGLLASRKMKQVMEAQVAEYARTHPERIDAIDPRQGHQA